MAGEWIKMRVDLPDDPVVYKLAAILGKDRLSIVGHLYAFWAWADKHAVDGCVDGGSSTVVDDVSRLPGFSDALVSVRWLVVGPDSITIPKHDRHNGESAKERSQKNARQARWRGKKDDAPSTPVDAQPSTKSSTREEKRREEVKPKNLGPETGPFDETWKAFPKRAGNNPRLDALKAWTARRREGVTAEALHAATERYATFCRATGKIGTEHVLRASTFFGSGKPYEQEFEAPKANGGGDAWWATDAGIVAKARSLGVDTLGYTAQVLKAKIQAKLGAQ